MVSPPFSALQVAIVADAVANITSQAASAAKTALSSALRDEDLSKTAPRRRTWFRLQSPSEYHSTGNGVALK